MRATASPDRLCVFDSSQQFKKLVQFIHIWWIQLLYKISQFLERIRWRAAIKREKADQRKWKRRKTSFCSRRLTVSWLSPVSWWRRLVKLSFREPLLNNRNQYTDLKYRRTGHHPSHFFSSPTDYFFVHRMKGIFSLSIDIQGKHVFAFRFS